MSAPGVDGPALRVGLIGCGQQGQRLARALRQVPNALLVACGDPDPHARGRVAGVHLARFDDVQQLLAVPRLDAVMIATPHHVLPAAAMAAFEAGCHVFCEKPIAPSADQARAVVAAGHRAERVLMVGYLQRFTPLRKQMKSLLERGVCGELSVIKASKGGQPLSGWAATHPTGGGMLLWVGSHLIDQLLWLVGRPVQRVFAEIHRAVPGGVDTTTVATLQFAGGVLAHIDCSQSAHEVYDVVEAAGTDGHVRAEWRPRYRLSVSSRCLPEYTRPMVQTERLRGLGYETIAEISEFVAAIREARAPAITGEDGLRVLQILDALRLSAQRNQPVTL